MAHYYKPPKTGCGNKCILMLMILVFLLTLTTFTLLDEHNKPSKDDTGKDSVLSRLLDCLKTKAGTQDTGEDFVFIESLPTDAQRSIRQVYDPVKEALEAAKKNASQSNKQDKNGYYEEQQAVLVHSESEPPLGYRQEGYGPPQEDDDPYYEQDMADYNSPADANDANDAHEEQDDQGAYYQDSPSNYDNTEDENKSAEVIDQADQSEARSSQNRQYDSYYRQRPHQPAAPAVDVNRKFRPAAVTANRARDPYAAYDYDYEYTPPAQTRQQPQTAQQIQSKLQKQQQQNQQQQQQLQSHQIQQYRPRNPQATTTPISNTQSPENALQNQSPNQEHTLISVVRGLKTMWDIYQAISAAWTAAAVKSAQREQQQLKIRKQQQQQLQSRINSKKPPVFADESETRNSTTKPKPNKATRRTTTPKTTTTTSTEEPPAKVEPRHKAKKGDADDKAEVQGMREKRQSAEKKEVAEGRYIKGDPLKGYYDFVITEGSYKFWAVFQFGTAILIIYSTFAAIYYSKVNPLVSDYDYQDYLGGARSMSGGDLDFVDDDEHSSSPDKSKPTHWFDWMPSAGQSLQRLLEIVDKLPVDHSEETEAKDSRDYDIRNEEQLEESVATSNDGGEQASIEETETATAY